MHGMDVAAGHPRSRFPREKAAMNRRVPKVADDTNATFARRRSHAALLVAAWGMLGSLVAERAGAQVPRALKAHPAAVYALAFSPAGGLLVSGGADRTLCFHQLDETPLPEAEQQRRRQLLVALDDERFEIRQQAFVELAALGDNMLPELQQVLETPASAEVRLRVLRLLQLLAMPAGSGHHGDVRSVSVSRDGTRIASASRDSRVIVWNVSSGRPLRVLEGHSEGAWCVAFAPHGRLLASGGGDQTVRLWSGESGELLRTLIGHGSTVHQVAFSPDGKTLASAGGFDKTCRLWDVETGRLQAVLDRHRDAVLCVAFSPDGCRLASCGYEGAVFLWSAAERRFEAEWQLGREVLRSVVFSPDSRYLACAGDDPSVRLWDVTAKRQIQRFQGHTDAVQALAFSPDGKRLASASRNGTILLWDVASPETRP
jgi:WD40 repeat protein